MALAALGLTSLGLTSGERAVAQDVSAWVRDNYSAVRLLAGARMGSDRVLIGGIEIKPQPGWKTYWRAPGDSGVPPRFDFSRSENIGVVSVLWPAPMKFADGAGGFSIGYAGRVILPLRIVPKDANKPVILRADMSYAVCDKLCVPVDASAEIAFAQASGSQDAALAAALANVPAPAHVGDPNPPAVRAVAVDQAKRRVTVTVAAPDDAAVELFAEGPTPDWTMSVPAQVGASASGTRQFVFDIDNIPPGASIGGAEFRLTLAGAGATHDIAVTMK
jgi:DsbC/DsbD-like thiol-disulfide interchange protein